MRMSEATTWDKKVLTLNDIRGVDLSSAPLGVKETRASYMKNMICKDGVNHKRNGFEEIASFYDENGNPMAINGIFPYTTSNGINNVLVHVGKELYLCDEHITLDRIKLADIGAEKTKCFFCEGKIYLVSNKKLYVYDGNETVPELFNSDSAYVPTTSIGITDEKHGSLLEPYD